jgi:hypothetical protein
MNKNNKCIMFMQNYDENGSIFQRHKLRVVYVFRGEYTYENTFAILQNY